MRTRFVNSGAKHGPDYLLVFSYLLLLFFGVIMLSSVSNAVAYQKFGDSYYYLKNQIFKGLIPGLSVCVFLAMTDYRRLKRLAFPLLVGSIVLLVAVFLPGVGYELMGARRWVSVFGVTFQPSEVVKLAFLLYLCAWVDRRGKTKIKDFSDGLMPFLSSLGIIMFLVAAQPDVGTMGIIVLVSIVIYFLAGASINHLAALGAGGLVLLGILIKVAPYRAARLTAFMNPEYDPLGIGYHINQALLAIGTGGLWGRGFGNSLQKKLYLPEVVGDSIFAVISEELGFVLVVALIFLFLFLFMRGFKVSRSAPDNFGRLLAAGITFWICFQAYVNIASMLNLIPMTGLTLPLVSYGSSSLVVILAAIGILISVSRYSVVRSGRRARKVG